MDDGVNPNNFSKTRLYIDQAIVITPVAVSSRIAIWSFPLPLLVWDNSVDRVDPDECVCVKTSLYIDLSSSQAIAICLIVWIVPHRINGFFIRSPRHPQHILRRLRLSWSYSRTAPQRPLMGTEESGRDGEVGVWYDIFFSGSTTCFFGGKFMLNWNL